MSLQALDNIDAGVTARSPGKVNLTLGVGPLRSDGYHELATVYQAVSVYDEVSVVEVEANDPTALVTVENASGEVPTGASNLAWKAVLALSRHTEREPNVRITVRKGIPVAGGMAGGSADAAATLVALDSLWGTDLGKDELARIAAEVGSDVPFLIHGGTAVGTGRGEIISPALARGEFHWVFALAEGGLMTPAVYKELDRLRDADKRDGAKNAPAANVPDALMAALRNGDAQALGAALHNDLQRAALSLKPKLKLTLDVGAEYNALGAVVSGSGPTVAFLVKSHEAALDLAVALTASGTCRTVLRATGPVPGARLT